MSPYALVVELVRSLGFGSLFGAGIGGCLWIFCGGSKQSAVSFDQSLLMGALLGAGTHQIIDKYISEGILKPLAPYAKAHFVLRYVGRLQNTGLIDQEQAAMLKDQTIDILFYPELAAAKTALTSNESLDHHKWADGQLKHIQREAENGREYMQLMLKHMVDLEESHRGEQRDQGTEIDFSKIQA